MADQIEARTSKDGGACWDDPDSHGEANRALHAIRPVPAVCVHVSRPFQGQAPRGIAAAAD